MAKKKHRSANVARKREKRNRNRKTRQKQLAIEKQRRIPYGKFDKERLQACLLNSRALIEEPELESLYFDFDLMYTHVLESVMDCESGFEPLTPIDTEGEVLDVVEKEPDSDVVTAEPDAEESDWNAPETLVEEARHRFQTDVLSQLITPEFVRTLSRALAACENRLRRIGHRNRAETANVARVFFEVVPSHLFVEHPLIQSIGIQTLEQLMERPEPLDTEHSMVRLILSEVLEMGSAKYEVVYEEEAVANLLSNVDVVEEDPAVFQAELAHADVAAPTSGLASDALIPVPETPPPDLAIPIPSPDSLPAKALYKNFEGLAIRDAFDVWEGSILQKETETQLDFFNVPQACYITVTENRLQLHTYSETELTAAMAEIEEHCQSGLMYLAKTIEEGGQVDATE